MKLLPLIILFFPFLLNAQSSSDTVYLPADTIYQKTVIEIVEYEPLESNWSGSVSAGVIWFQNTQRYQTYRDVSMLSQLGIKYEVEKLFAEIGVQHSSFGYEKQMVYTNKSTVTSPKTVTDTVSTYTSIINNIKETRYITKERTFSQVDTVTSDSIVSISNRYRLIGIPIVIGRDISLNNVTLSPALGLVPQFIIPAKGNLAETEQGTYIDETAQLKPFALAISAQLAVGYTITDRFAVFGKYAFSQYVTNAYTSDRFYLRSHSLSAGLTIMLTH